MPRSVFLFLTLIAVGLPSAGPLTAQVDLWDPARLQRQQIDQHSRVILQSRVIFGVSASFANLGEVSYALDEDDDNDGDFTELLFDDGYINFEADGSTFTSDFGFQMENAEFNAEGLVDAFTLSRYRSTATDEIFEDDASSVGWEVAYQYQFGRPRDRFRYGFVAGFALNRFEFNIEETVNGQLFSQTATVSLTNPQITYVAGGTYRGGPDGPSIDLEQDLDFDPNAEGPVTQSVWPEGEVIVPADVDSTVDLETIFTNFRLGPTISWQPFDRFHLQASAGFNLTYFYQDVDILETITFVENIGGATTDFTDGDDKTDSSEWLAGFYVEGAAYYYLNNHAAIYGSWQVFDTNNPEPAETEDVVYEVDLADTMVISVGLEMDF